MKILITAGPTRQPIDQVRYISNRSSGRMGISLANAACASGHDVTLLLGNVCLKPARECTIYHFETAENLNALLNKHFPDCDLLIMAAAVSDYTVAANPGKIKRQTGKNLTLTLTPTADLVSAIAQKKTPNQRIIAFALENANSKTELEKLGKDKLKRKNADAIVANPLQTMDATDTAPLLITKDGKCAQPKLNAQGKISKEDFAKWLIEKMADNY